MDTKRMQSLIRRRKAVNRVFAVVGMLSVCVGLATLAALMVKLAGDARWRLTVPRGSVAVTEGRVTGPGSRELAPFEQAWEVRKLSGDALRELAGDEKLLWTLIDVRQMIDVDRLKEEARAGTLRERLAEDRYAPLLRTDHVRRLLADGRAGRLVRVDNVVAPDRAAELSADNGAAMVLDVAAVRELVAEEDGLKALFNRLNLRLNAAASAEGGNSILAQWVRSGEFEENLPRLLNQRKIASLVSESGLRRFIDQELAVAANRPREFNRSFFTTLKTSAYPETAGILTAWVGSLCVILVCMLAALPIGVAAGVYLEEYAPRNRLSALIEVNISNLAGVPSIIYGLMALGLFIYLLHMGRTIATAGLTLALLVLPIVIMATREAIRAIPQNIREASYACGATRWQTVRHHVLPYSGGGILTGTIIALSRAIGETAPIITIALLFVTNLPPSPVQAQFPFLSFQWLGSSFTVMPLIMYNWTSRPEPEFHHNAALAGLVLIVMTLGLNALAIYLRYRLRQRIKW